MVNTNELTQTEQDITKESIKLIKNSKGYNWEIKVKDDIVTLEKTCKRLHEINEELDKKYGTK